MSLRQISRISRISLSIRNFSSSVDRNSIHPTASNLENKIPKMEEFQKIYDDTKSKDQKFKRTSSLIIGGFGITTFIYFLSDLKKKNTTIMSKVIKLENKISKMEEFKKIQTEIEYDIAVNNFIGGLTIGALLYNLFGK